jgi:hypothetical protein
MHTTSWSWTTYGRYIVVVLVVVVVFVLLFHCRCQYRCRCRSRRRSRSRCLVLLASIIEYCPLSCVGHFRFGVSLCCDCLSILSALSCLVLSCLVLTCWSFVERLRCALVGMSRSCLNLRLPDISDCFLPCFSDCVLQCDSLVLS